MAPKHRLAPRSSRGRGNPEWAGWRAEGAPRATPGKKRRAPVKHQLCVAAQHYLVDLAMGRRKGKSAPSGEGQREKYPFRGA